VRRIRILLADMPRMLLDMLTDIVVAHPDMMVSGKMQETADICTAVKKVKADVVILSEPAGRQRRGHRELLYSRPHLKVLSITSDGHRLFLHELRPFRAALGEISPESLVQAIQSRAERRLG
jgi:DNA-binding NarL/FixJ family response regulator